jgi:hypothetical protein
VQPYVSVRGRKETHEHEQERYHVDLDRHFSFRGESRSARLSTHQRQILTSSILRRLPSEGLLSRPSEINGTLAPLPMLAVFILATVPRLIV